MQFERQGILTAQDSKRYISHPFMVPEGATRLDIDFEYSPKRVEKYGNLLTLSLFDPYGERGTGHRGQPNQHVTLGTTDTTPGYVPGPLPPGAWDIMINANLINPGPAINYRLMVTVGFDAQPEAVALPRGVTNPRGPGWYRGDLHGHTVHSDGAWDAVALLNFAREQRLDFVTLTDHNTVSGLAQMDSLSSDEVLTMGGFELTTFYGHALALGLRQWIDWRVRPGERTMTDIMAQVEACGGLFVIAHPTAPGDPICTGCQWEYDDLMPGKAAVVEVWNEHWDSISNNEEAVQLWYQWLNAGHRIYATVGTDIHGAPDAALEFGFNVVYADALAETAILDALKHGHLYLSSGPRLSFTGKSSSGETAMMGETIAGESCQVSVQWEGRREGDRLRLIRDGQVFDERAAATAGEQSWALDGRHWYLIEVRNQQGHMRALTNPIFVGT